MDTTVIGTAGLQGWRAKVIDRLAPPLADRSKLSEDQVRAVAGALFLVLTISYLVGVVRELAANR